jgi:hypothetical protein
MTHHDEKSLQNKNKIEILSERQFCMHTTIMALTSHTRSPPLILAVAQFNPFLGKMKSVSLSERTYIQSGCRDGVRYDGRG